MPKINCWEFRKCGREPGGSKIDEFGVCPASIEVRANGINGGKNGGRACWAIDGTLCLGTLAQKYCKCTECEFYKLVTSEEKNCMIAPEIRKKIGEKK